MPFYEYECSACKYYLEVLQKITDAPMTKCPSCGKEALHRLISAPVFRLKGSGWYETDFKSDKENKRNLVDSGAGDKEPSKSDSDDSQAKVRVSKALKKATGKKAKIGQKKVDQKARAKAAKKTGKSSPAGKAKSQPAKKKVTVKSVTKAAQKPAYKPTKKTSKKVAKKSAGKPAKKVVKTVAKKTAKKK
jgi:putative FmdB family regulatory protein